MQFKQQMQSTKQQSQTMQAEQTIFQKAQGRDIAKDTKYRAQ